MSDEAAGDDTSTVPGDDAQPAGAAIDEEAVSEPVEVDEDGGGEQRIAQEPSGSQGSAGGGEFPSVGAKPSASAPGSVEERRKEIVEARQERAEAAGSPSRHGTDEADGSFKEVLEADPELGGSSSQPG